MNKDSHIHPKCYLERWKISSTLSQWEKKMVYVFPYNQFELIKTVSIDNEFFKKTNYYATFSEGGELENNLETLLSWIYETALQKLLDYWLEKVQKWISWEENQIKISQEILEKIYTFLAYTFFRSPCWEVYWLTIESILKQKSVPGIESMKLWKFHFNMNNNVIETADFFLMSKLAYNDNYIGNTEMIKFVQSMFQNMNLIFLYAGWNVNFLTNNEVFTLFEFSETLQQSTFLIPLDPRLCILLWWEKDDSNLKVSLNTDEEVKKVNWAILWNQVLKKPHKFVIWNQINEIQRLISDYNLIISK